MPKVVVTDARGLVQETGAGIEILTHGAVGTKFTSATTLINVGANDTALTIVQPANTLLVDVGVVLTKAIAGSSGIVQVKVGTTNDGAQICAASDLMSGATAAAVGSGISLVNKSEGAATLSFAANSPQYTATERTLHIRIEASAAITAGEAVAFIKYMKLPA